MDQLRLQLQRISEQIGGLSASQRMLTLCLVAIMVITMLWWGHYAATPELVPILDRSMSADDITRIKSALASVGITPRVVNDRITVPVERHVEALAALGYARALPSDSVDAWDEIVKQSGPWETAEKTGELFKRAKEKMLSQVVRTFPGVSVANVFINPKNERRIGGGGNLEASASVIIEARQDAPIKHMIDSAALTVANTVSGLKVSNVSVVINGRPYRPRDPSRSDMFGGNDQYEVIQQLEDRYIDKIRNSIPFPNALVTVAVDLETKSGHEVRETYDGKNTLHKEMSVETETSETQAAQRSMPTEPGAIPNMGLSIDGTAGTSDGGSTTTELNRTQFQVLPSKSVETINKPPGGYKVMRASVRLPMSHFHSIYKRRNPAATSEPDDAELEPLILREIEAVKKDVVACCGMTSDETVTVAPYDDLFPPMAAAVADTMPAASVAGVITRHGKEIAIGVLAVVSLFMVSTMIRKGPQVATITSPMELREATPLASDEDIAGEVGEGGAMLDGMELDEDTIRAQQMVEQVSTMVKENPDAAASLVKRWLNRN